MLIEAEFTKTLHPMAVEEFARLEKLQDKSIKAMEKYPGTFLQSAPKGGTYK